MKCLLCNKEIYQNELTYQLKKETKSHQFRITHFYIHQSCMNKLMWERDYPEIKLNDFTIQHIKPSETYYVNKGWNLGSFKITKFTQENLDKLEVKLIKKLAKKALLE